MGTETWNLWPGKVVEFEVEKEDPI